MQKVIMRALASLLLVLLPASAWAYEVGPLRVFLNPANGQLAETVVVTNTRDTDLFIEVRSLCRIVDALGEQTFEGCDDDFILFPPQARVDAGQSQAIRLQYIGDPNLAVGQAYVVQIAEVPVQTENQSGIRFAYNFGVAVYISPTTPSAELTVTDASLVNNLLTFNIENSGNDYDFLNLWSMELDLDGETIELPREELAALVEMPILPPATVRTFELAYESPRTGVITNARLKHRVE